MQVERNDAFIIRPACFSFFINITIEELELVWKRLQRL